MILRGLSNIRDVIAFPKTQSGSDLMCGAPATIDDKQLREAEYTRQRPRQDRASFGVILFQPPPLAGARFAGAR